MFASGQIVSTSRFALDRVLVDGTRQNGTWFAAYLASESCTVYTPPSRTFCYASWQLDEQTGQYYYHAFLSAQPKLNWCNPEVQAPDRDNEKIDGPIELRAQDGIIVRLDDG